MYHSISSSTEHMELCITPSVFQAQMKMLHHMGYRGVSLLEGLTIFESQTVRDAKVIVLTFDDGYEDNLHHALPILHELDYTATCFFVAEKLGSESFDIWSNGTHRLMDSNQLKEWSRMGMEVGSHTLTHPNLTKIDKAHAKHEIADSKTILSDLTGCPVSSFAYPYGVYNNQICQYVGETGYGQAVTVKPRSAYHFDHQLKLPRIGIVPRHAPWLLRTKIKTPYVDLKVLVEEAFRSCVRQ